MASQTDIKKVMNSTMGQFIDPNKLTKQDLKKIISTLSREEINQMKAYVNNKCPKNSNGSFFVTRAYLYNRYIKPQNENNKDMGYSPKHTEDTFLDFLNSL